jgi:PAS domain S-box-containing protein
MLACIFQHSPNVIISRKDRNILTPHDIANSKTVILPGGHVELSAMLLSEGVDPKPFCQQPQGRHLKDLIDGKIDAIDGYITNEVFTVRQAGVPVSIMSPVNYGIDFYGDTLITSEKELLDYPDRVRKFRAASLRGWKYAMAHPQELVDIILNKYTTRKSREHLLYEAEMTQKLVMHELVEIGHINPGRCQRMIAVLDKQNKIKLDINLEKLIYDPNPKGISARNLFLIKIFIGVIAIISLVTFGLYYFNRRLRNEITFRKKAEVKLHESEKQTRMWLENSPVCTKIVDLDFNLKYMSAAGIKALKIDDVTQLYGKPYPFDFYPESFLNCMTKNLEKVKETGEIITQEASVVDIDRNELWFHSTLVPVNDDEGRIDYIIIVSIDITERKLAEEQIKTSLKEKEVLLKEIHHRVKNNMQIMASLLRLQSEGIKDKHLRDLFDESRNRIKSMALIHEDLYSGKDLARIDFGQYTRKLTGRLISAYEVDPNRIITSVNIDNVFLGVDTAIPCGLIINELFTNSLKYAFPVDKFGVNLKDKKEEIRIGCHSNSAEHTLVFSDNGVGLPEDINFQKTETLGLDLVKSLTRQLGGTIKLNRNSGTEFTITFKA